MGLLDLFRRKKNTPVSKNIPAEAPTAPTERRTEPAAPIVSPTPKVDAEAAKREAAERAWLASERENSFRSMGISDPRTTKPKIQQTQPKSQNPTPKSAELTKREEDLEQIAQVAKFFGKTPTTADGRPFALQADHYIISMLPPELDEAKTKELSRAIIAANGYVAGNATWEVRVNAMALDNTFSMFSLAGFEKRTGKKADPGRTRIHDFGGNWSVTGTDVKGKMLAVFFEK